MKTKQEMRDEFEKYWNSKFVDDDAGLFLRKNLAAWQARQPEIDARDEEIANLKEINKSQKTYEEKLETQIKLLEKQDKLQKTLILSNELSISLHKEVNCKKDAEIIRLREALEKSNNRMYSVITTHSIHRDVVNRIKERIDINKEILKGIKPK